MSNFNLLRREAARLVRPALTALALAASAPTWADIVYVDIPDTNVVVSENIVVIDLDRDGPGPYVQTVPYYADFDASIDLVVGQYSATLTSVIEHVEFTMINGQSLANASAAIVHRLGEGASIGPSSGTWYLGNSWIEFQGNGQGAWNGFNGEAYIGFRFDPTHTATSFNYGWFRVNYSDAMNRLTLLDYAYESTPNTAIAAGSVVAAVPEAGAALLIACVGLAVMGIQAPGIVRTVLNRAARGGPGATDSLDV